VKTFLKNLLLSLLLTGAGFSVYGQDSTFKAPVLPAISAGPGILFYKGDIGGGRTRESLRSHIGLRLGIQLLTREHFSVNAYYLSGRTTANSYDPERPLNFESVFFSQGLSFRYDLNLSKTYKEPTVLPYVSAGIGFLSFRSSTDLTDASGKYYHYWNDGTIRSESETGSNAASAVLLYRDYVYETDLREADLDGFGKYRPNTVCFPLEAGFTLRMTDHSSFVLSAAYQLLQTDLIDGITDQSLGGRRGDTKNDRLIYTGCAYRYDLSPKKKKVKDGFEQIDFKKLAKEDFDKDGIKDVSDAVTDTVKASVDTKGRPSDTDKDGIPNYRDAEPMSSPTLTVDETGVTLTDEMQENRAKVQEEIVPADTVYLRPIDWLNPDATADPVSRNKTVIPSDFVMVDKNQDGYISPPEMSKAAADFNAGKSPYQRKDFYRLIDFFFRQQQ
jgi:hypothetical protein